MSLTPALLHIAESLTKAQLAGLIESLPETGGLTVTQQVCGMEPRHRALAVEAFVGRRVLIGEVDRGPCVGHLVATSYSYEQEERYAVMVVPGHEHTARLIEFGAITLMQEVDQ